MTRLWMKLYRNHRMVRQGIAPCTLEDLDTPVREICKSLDIPCPIWLGKHEREFDEFRRTIFTRDHFIEEIDFDQMEIEYLDDQEKKRKSRDPRNQFDGF